MENVQVLYRFQNRLYGPIPHKLGQMINLYKLDLSINNISGSIPSSLGNIEELQFFNPEIGNLRNLVQMELYINSLNGSILPHLVA